MIRVAAFGTLKRGSVAQLSTLDRRRVRTAFQQRFTARRMAEDYVRQYRALAGP
jgi:hypothetical protein